MIRRRVGQRGCKGKLTYCRRGTALELVSCFAVWESYSPELRIDELATAWVVDTAESSRAGFQGGGVFAPMGGSFAAGVIGGPRRLLVSAYRWGEQEDGRQERQVPPGAHPQGHPK